MSGIYFTTMALLVLTGYYLSQQRAQGVSREVGGANMHSLPAYHGLYAATLIFLPMLLVFAIGAPIVDRC